MERSEDSGIWYIFIPSLDFYLTSFYLFDANQYYLIAWAKLCPS
jgi:hypothetical protein